MTLLELSVQYRAGAQMLHQRQQLLRSAWQEEADEHSRRRLEQRLHNLEAMRREAQELAVLCERYYDRGYHRNVRYTV